MARWRRWRRWRRPWWRRRRRTRRRRLWRRRPRRPLRRRRRRRTVRRRRRWGRRRGRLTYRRRFRRRRKRKRLVLTQWNPATVRRCLIKGIAPLLICGHTRWNRNFALHSEDYPEQGRYPYGGSLSTTTWSLQVLFDEHQKFLNRWTSSNEDLDLARYKGCRFTFYRDPKTDYIVTYNNVPPMKNTLLTGPMSHPGMMMQAKHKILIPSFQTHPGGPVKISVRISPPTLFDDKWYTQQDLCEVPLVSITATAASFLHPFCPPLTNNPCVTFQVLKQMYNENIAATDETAKTLWETLIQNPAYFETFLTQSLLLGKTKAGKKNDTNADLDDFNHVKTGNNSQFGFHTYDKTKLSEAMKKAREWYNTQYKQQNDLHSQYGKPQGEGYLGYAVGAYSPIFLCSSRSNLEFERAYQDVTYNPLADRGKGNMVWFQYSTKPTTEFNETQCKCVIQDLPLWAALHGYPDYVESSLGISSEIHNFGIVCIYCPYTFPPMTAKSKTEPNNKMGFVVYDTMFGNGKMPDGRGHIPIYWQSRWFVRMAFQVQVLHDITMTGPFSYKDDLVSTTLTVKYSFKFLWGGNAISTQTVKNPCRHDPQDAAFPGRKPRSVQVVDPRTVGPQWVFHTWDWRRGLFGKAAIKRMSQKPTDDDEHTAPYKKPRYFPPADQAGQESDSGTQATTRIPWTPPGRGQPHSPASLDRGVERRLLRDRLREQQLMGEQLRELLHQMFKTQSNLHVNPMFFQEL
nr:ORF1 [nabpantry virus 5]